MSLTPTLITPGMLAEGAEAYIAAQPPTRLSVASIQPRFRRGSSEAQLAALRSGIRSHFPSEERVARAEGQPSRAGRIRERPQVAGPGLELGYTVTAGLGIYQILRPCEPVSRPLIETRRVASGSRRSVGRPRPATPEEQRASLRQLCERARNHLGRAGELATQAEGEDLSPAQARRLAAQALRHYRAAVRGRRQVLQRVETMSPEDRQRVQAFAHHESWQGFGTAVLGTARTHGVRLPSRL